MWHKSVAALAFSQLLLPLGVQAAATWPSSIDEIENLLMLQTGHNAPGFASVVTPCSNSYAKGFRIAAGLLRTAFHDVAAYDAGAGTGGLDASIGYELQAPFSDHNNGPDFYGAMTWYSSFFNSKASMADLVALGVYASVRSCGGPTVPIRAGRKDATRAGPNSLPDSADSASVLTGRFAKMGFSPQEMIQMVACGHTLGGLHVGVNSKFNPQDPNAAAQAAQQGVQPFDTTDAGFDSRVASEYVSGTTKNPLVNGAKVELRSDLKVFSVDNNRTIKAMAASNSVFQGVCQDILQKMIERVPSGVQLSDVIQPYDVKPGQLNLNVVDGGKNLLFSGEIRIRTTQLSVKSVTLQYLGRAGDAPGTITTSKSGDARGFDESFSFFGFSQKVPSITSFTVLVTTASGAVVPFTNNGQGFPVNDGAFVQMSSSSLSGSQLKVVVAMRGSQSAPAMTLSIRSDPVFNTLPKISTSSCSVSKVCSDATWSYYTGTFNVNPSKIGSAKLDVSVGGTVVDGFRSINFPSSGVAPVCGSTTSSSTTSSQSSTSLSSTISSTLSSSSSSLSSSSSSLTSSGSSSTSSGSSSLTSSSSSLTSSGSSSTSSGSSSSSSSSVSGSSSTSSGSSSLTSSSSSKTSVSGTLISTSSSSGTSSGASSSTSSTSSGQSTLSSTTTASSSGYGSSLTTTTSSSDTSVADTSSTWTTTTGTETWTGSSTTWTDSVSGTWTSSETWTDSVSGTWTSSVSDMWGTWTDSESATETWTGSSTTWTESVTDTSSAPAWTAWEGVSSVGSVASHDHSSALGAMSSIYAASANQAAPSGGSDGGNKNIQGLDLSIVVSQVSLTITATTVVFTIPDYAQQTDSPAYGGGEAAGSGSTWAVVPTGNTWVSAPAPGQTWVTASVPTAAPASSPLVAAWSPYASATKSGWVATYTGGADSQVMARKEAVMGAAAVVFGAVVMAL